MLLLGDLSGDFARALRLDVRFSSLLRVLFGTSLGKGARLEESWVNNHVSNAALVGDVALRLEDLVDHLRLLLLLHHGLQDLLEDYVLGRAFGHL